MLLQERQVLSPDQRVKLNKLHEQWERDHKRPLTRRRQVMERLAMTRNGSIWMLDRGRSPVAALAAPARAQQLSEARIQRTDQAGGRDAWRAAQAPAPQQPPARPGDTRPVVPLTLDDAVKLALDRNLDIAVQRLNPEINDIAVASLRVGLPPDADVAIVDRSRRPTPSTIDDLGRLAAGAPIVAGADHLQRRHRAEHSVGRRQLHRRAEQQPRRRRPA